MPEEIELTGDLRIQYSAVYRYADAIINNLGEKAFFTDNKHKRYKELFLGALVGQAVSEHTGEYYYVTSPDNDPPDFMLRLLRKHEGEEDKTDEQGFNFEVTDYTEHDKSIADVIDKKLVKGYPDNYSLVVFFRHPTETTFDYQELVNKYKDNKHWIVVLMRTNKSKSGIQLSEWHWCVVAVSNPTVQKLIKPDRTNKTDVPQMWYQKGRGRDIPPNTKPVKIKLPD